MKPVETMPSRPTVNDVGATTDATLATITTDGTARRLPSWVRICAIIVVSAFALGLAINLLAVLLDLAAAFN